MQYRTGPAVFAIVLLAILVRTWGAFSDLPYMYHPDEPGVIITAQHILKTGDWNPHRFDYPSMVFYVNALACLPYYLTGKLFGVFHRLDDILPPHILVMGSAYAQTPGAVILGRCTTILFSTGSVLCMYFIGSKLTGKHRVGLLAALMLAVSPTNVAQARFVTPNTYVTFWLLATLCASVLILQQGKLRHYLCAGICLGFTVSSKYNGAPAALFILIAHILRGGNPLFAWRLYLAALVSLLCFLAVNPFALFDFPHFLADLRFDSNMYSTGHAGMEGHAPAWYVRYLTTSEGLLLFLAAIQMARGCYQRSKPTILISVFSIGYFLFVCRYAVRNDRTILPLIPCLALLSSFFLAEPYKESISSRLGRWRYILPVGLTALSLTILIANTVRDTIKLKTPDGRTTARIWIDGQLPAGSKIAIEKYAPYISSARFSISGLPMLVDHPLEWYRQNKFAYVVFSQGMYGRFFGDKKRYKFIVRQYTSLFEQLRPVKMFDDGGYEVRVYAVNPASTEVAH